MKKLFALAALVLGLASCQTEPEGLGVVTGGEIDTVVTVSLPAATRSSEDSGLANVDAATYDLRYILEVYDVNSNNLRVLREVKPYEVTETTVTFPVRLIAGRDYKFVVWADFVANGSNDDNHYYTQGGLYNVTVIDNAWTANTEARDAYTSFVVVENYSGTQSINLELTRPFGKLRVVTTDIDALRYINALPTAVEFQYAAEAKVYTSFNALTGEAGTEASKTFEYDLTNVYNEDLENGNKQTLFADYLFVGAKQTLTTKFYMQVSHAYGAKKTAYSFVNDAPIVRNQLTTVIGSILTDANNVEVKVENEFAAKNTILDVFENGGEYTLTENIELPANNLIVKKDVVLNLGDYTINAGKPDSAEMTGTDIAAITVVDGATLTIEGAGTIQGTEYGVYVKNGNVVIKGGNFVAGTSAVQVYNGTATIEGGKFEATNSDVYVVNCIDANWKNGTANVAIKGGEFKNFNPANNAAEGANTNFCAEGYGVFENDDWFEVLYTGGESTINAVVNNADELNAAMAQGGVIILAEGEFGTIVAKSDVTLVGTPEAKVDVVVLNGAANLTLRNITFDAATAKYGYDFNGTKKVWAYSNIITGDETNKPTIGARNLTIDGCEFTGSDTNGGSAIAFTDQGRKGGYSDNITIKNCKFAIEGAYYHIYGHYMGNYGYFVLENNVFETNVTAGPVYLGRYTDGKNVTVKGNHFKKVDSLEDAVYVQSNNNIRMNVTAENNIFGE